MCGSVGVLRFDGGSFENRPLIEAMRDALTHRGPDEAGIHLDGPVGLGFRRLSVIDIPGGSQPMVHPSTGTAVVFNGEIYNYRELRRELEGFGHVFRTRSDTEAILHSYLKWGTDAASHLIGMFAFALWDPRTQTLHMARDRLGVKPLFWTRIGDQFLFASEIKAFFHHPDFQAKPNLDAISSYLSFRQAIWHLTFFDGVHKLLPGHWMEVTCQGLLDRAYWELPVPVPDESLDEETCLGRVEELLQRALDRCMVSDIPVGAFLSGGLDSSILTAMMRRQHPNQIRTYSIGYGHAEYDEGEHAKLVAEHFGTEHTHLTMQRAAFTDLWPGLVRQRDAPLSIPHEIPLFCLSKKIKESISVAIAGDGADELFGGYGRVMRSPGDWKKIALARRLLGSRLAGHIGSARWARGTACSWFRLDSHLGHFLEVYSWMPRQEKMKLFSADARQVIGDHDAALSVFEALFQKAAYADPYDRVLHAFQKIHLGCLLEKLDAIGMAASIEGRVPFVDHELVEFVVQMPIRYKLRWNSWASRWRSLFQTADRVSEKLDTTKSLLRRLGLRLIPSVIAGRKKLGFPTPLDAWMQQGLLASARELLLDSRTRERGLFDMDNLNQFLQNPQQLPYDFYGKKVWMLMNIELWFREVVEQRATPCGPRVT